MKRKLLILSLGILIFSLLFAISVFATVDYGETATLADGFTLPIYDENQNPLIWYVSGVDSDGNNIYKSVPNNRNEPNESNDVYVTYTINTSWMTQLENINIHVWNADMGEYEIFTEENFPVVIVNLRGISDFEYINTGFKVSDIQYIYFNENLKDFCDYFKGSTSLRLVDLSECTALTGGFGGNRNFYNCTNLHTIRLAPGASYTLICSINNNWRFSNTAITQIVIPDNVTSLGVDNFKNNTLLESIYILGNTTSLGQRNFLGCSKLENIYILGDNPSIDITSFKENFYECVDGTSTLNFTNIGKYFFFATANSDYLSQVKEAIGATEIITYSDYVANPSNFTEGRYIISETNICDVYYGEHKITHEAGNNCVGTCDVCGDTIINHQATEKLTSTIEYSNYAENGTKKTFCNNEGCTYCVTSETAPLFTCLGYSAQGYGNGGILVGFGVNDTAISEYASITGKNLKFGLFAGRDTKLGTSDAVNTDGEALTGIASVDYTERGFDIVEFKVIGFVTDEHKNANLVLGLYVIDAESVSYVQVSKPNDGEKYSYISYNGLING